MCKNRRKIKTMKIFLGRLPILLEFLINGLFVLSYTLYKSNKEVSIIESTPVKLLLEHANWIVPFVLILSLCSQFLKSENLESFFRKSVFSLIVVVPVIITWGDIEFVYWLSAVHLFSSLLSIYEKKEQVQDQAIVTSSFLFRLKLSPAEVILISFGGWILIGALVLMLPVSAAPENRSFLSMRCLCRHLQLVLLVSLLFLCQIALVFLAKWLC